MDLLQLTKKSESRILALHPSLQGPAFELIKLCFKEELYILITQGLRTMEEQQALYNQGRTTQGNVVTNAKPGESYHNYGVAFDFAVYTDESCTDINWDVDSRWMRVGTIGESLGLEWGGSWDSFKDYPHFQVAGYSLDDLRAGERPEVPTVEVEKEEDVVMPQVVAEWAKESQQWVMDSGISDGQRPVDNVKRQEAWAMIHNLYSMLSKSPEESQGVADWAEEAQRWVKDKGISDGQRPTDNLTRQEAWAMLSNLYKELNK